jgi:hypothetical protein
MHSKPQRVATIAGASEVDRAIGKLVLWLLALIRLRAGCMTIRINTYYTSRGYFGLLEQARLKQAQRNAPATASASRFGFHRAFTATMANLKP